MTKRVAAVLLALLFVLQVVAVIANASRQPHRDEVEYLHAAWLMEKGERLYAGFFEHHPPFLFAALQTVADDDVPLFLRRARLLSGAVGLLAMAVFAAVLWRVRPEAAVIAVGLLFAANTLWESGLVSARAEPFAFAFFWTGVALVLLERGDGVRQAVVSGIGAGCIAIAALCMPKWPFCSVVVIAFWLAGTRRRVLSGAVALAITSAAVLLMHAIAPLDQVWFFTVDYTRAHWPWLSRSRAHLEAFGDQPFVLAPRLLGPITLAVGVAVVAAALRHLREKRVIAFFLALTCAAALEIRFTFPWPVLWRWYYLMWGFAAAALIGFAPAAVEALLARVRVARAIAVALTVVILLVAAAQIAALVSFTPDSRSAQSPTVAYIATRLQPGDTVLLEVPRHPIAARDAGYYWFGGGEITAVAEELRRTPRGARFLPPVTHPFCAIANGEPTTLRFVSAPTRLGAPRREQQCFARALAAGRFRRTPVADVFEVVR